MSTKPYVKPTEQKVPLGTHSAHADSIHQSWPIANVLRLRVLSSNAMAFFRAKRFTTEWYQRHDLDTSVVAKASMIPYYAVKPCNDWYVRNDIGNRKLTVWWPTVFHPVWYKANLQKAINDVIRKWSGSVTLAGGFNFHISIAWKMAARI